MNNKQGCLVGSLLFAAIASYLEVNGQSGGFLWLACVFCFMGTFD